MIPLTRRVWLVGSVAVGLSAFAQVPANPRWFDALEREQGRHRFRYWGFDVYEAQLRVGPGFDPQAWEQHPLALSLTYARSFKGADIARRSIDEISRQGPLADDVRQRWLAQLSALFPDVSPGDTLVGAYRPQHGLQLWRRTPAWQNGGEVGDLDLARRFFGIWLSPQTSEPAMRSALLRLT